MYPAVWRFRPKSNYKEVGVRVVNRYNFYPVSSVHYFTRVAKMTTNRSGEEQCTSDTRIELTTITLTSIRRQRNYRYLTARYSYAKGIKSSGLLRGE
jgi:hypothetical protein